MLRRRRQEVHVNQERWLISYADFITLLFAFFVVMYSVSQVNDSKYRVLSATFGEAFNQSGKNKTQLPPPPPIANDDRLNQSVVDTSPTVSSEIVVTTELVSTSVASSAKSEVSLEKTSDELTQISDLVTEKFAPLINEQMIQVASNELWLQIELKDSILFNSGGADPSAQAIAIFDEIAGILTNYSNPIQVEGFTDNVPINSPRYPTNWELSTARASAIVKVLANKGIAPERLAAVGYGEYQPKTDNNTPEARAQNRRVTIMVAKRKMDRPTPKALNSVDSKLN